MSGTGAIYPCSAVDKFFSARRIYPLDCRGNFRAVGKFTLVVRKVKISSVAKSAPKNRLAQNHSVAIYPRRPRGQEIARRKISPENLSGAKSLGCKFTSKIIKLFLRATEHFARIFRSGGWGTPQLNRAFGWRSLRKVLIALITFTIRKFSIPNLAVFIGANSQTHKTQSSRRR